MSMAQTPLSPAAEPQPLPELAAGKQHSQTLDKTGGAQPQANTMQRMNSQEHDHRQNNQDLIAPAIS